MACALDEVGHVVAEDRASRQALLGPSPLFLRRDAVSFGRVWRKDVLDREVHPDQRLGVRRRGQNAVADLLDRVLHLAPPRLVGPVAVLEPDGRRGEGLAPLGELVDHLVRRLEDLAVVDEHDAVADGRGHDVLAEVLQEHEVGGVMRPGRRQPTPGHLVGHRVAEVGVIGAVPLDVDADPDDALVMAVAVEHHVEGLFDGRPARLGLEPDAVAELVEELEHGLADVLGHPRDERVAAGMDRE